MRHLIIFGLLLLVATSQAKTLIVNPTGAEDAKTLSAAIALASPGDEVMVREGDYSGAVVDRSISITGRDRAVVKGTLTVTAPGCRISGLSIQADGSAPAIVLQSPDNVLVRCAVRGAGSGIRVEDQNNTVADGRIESVLGVELIGSGSRVLNSTFRGEVGIGIKSSSANTIRGCSFSATRGIEIESSEKNRIENNSFSGMMGFGVTLTKSSGNWISGNSLSGTYVSGLDVVESSGNNLSGNSITGSKLGISLRRSDNSSLIANVCRGNERAGIYSDRSFNNLLEGNILNGNGNGILLTGSGENMLFSNNASLNTYGISLRGAPKNVLKNNMFNDNAYNLRIDNGETSSASLGSSNQEFFLQEIDSSNQVDGRPICYLIGESNQEVPIGCGFIGLVGCRNILVRNQTLSNSSAGVLLVNSTACRIENVTLFQDEVGVHLRNCTAFVVSNCHSLACQTGFLAAGCRDGNFERDVAANSSSDGFYADGSLNLTWTECSALSSARGIALQGTRLGDVLNCNASENREAGIMLSNSHKCLLDGNQASGNERGIALSGSNACVLSRNNALLNQRDGLSLEQLSGTEVLENTARSNGQGLFIQSSARLLIQGNNLSENSRFGLRMSSSSGCNITDNSFVKNQFTGANLVDCRENFLYHNVFVENGIQNAADNGANQWDSGQISGGNYWSDHAVKGNPADVPRQIPAKGVDRYPFQEPWGWL